MKIQFDSSALLAGIGLVPWTRLGPERWFTNYKIASLYGWDMHDVPGAPQVVAFADRVSPVPELKRLNTQSLLATPSFRDMITEDFAGYDFMTYKPVVVPAELADAGYTFLTMDQDLAQKIENKATFRELFAGELVFPDYAIVERASVTADAEGFASIMAGRDAVVVQDEQLSGGKGTYIVRDLSDLQRALNAFEQLDAGSRVIISDLIPNARERSVQCVATKYGVFVGPLQKQIVRHPLLSNLNVTEGDRFCGGEISANDPLQEVYPHIKEYAELIGKRLLELGYRGIFGVDCLVDETGEVFVLEVNPRITGMTPLLTMLYREGKDIPFYLLHLLELGNIDYTIEDYTIDPVPQEGSLLVLHSQAPNTVLITETPASGTYDIDGNFLEKQYRLNIGAADQQLLVQRYTPPNFKIKPGGRLTTVFSNRPVLDADDHLLPEITNVVASLLDRIKLKEQQL